MAIDFVHTTFRKRDIYTITLSGHVGYFREAIRRTPGTSEYRRSGFNGSAGINTTCTVQFETPDETIHAALMSNYHAVCQEKKQRKHV